MATRTRATPARTEPQHERARKQEPVTQGRHKKALAGDVLQDAMHTRAPERVLALQAVLGNRAVRALLAGPPIVAHTGAAAAAGARAMGAAAFTTGGHVAFAGEPSLHTAAHEAAHAIQQRAGVQLAGGVGQAGDRHEQHADAVANEVAQGRSTEALLDAYVGAVGAPVIQRMVIGDAVKGVFSADFPPTGPVAAEFYGSKFFGKEFKVVADFNPDRAAGKSDDKYLTGEYRQYVKGYFKDGAQYLDHDMGGGVMLDRNEFNEDGFRTGEKYGHRTKPDSHGRYTDAGEEGSHYEATDKPSIPVNKGDTVAMHLEFRGDLIVTDEKSKAAGHLLDSRTWTISGTCTRKKNGDVVLGQVVDEAPKAPKGGQGKDGGRKDKKKTLTASGPTEPVIQRKTAVELEADIDEAGRKAIVAAHVALQRNVAVDSTKGADAVLDTLGISATWKTVDIDNALFAVLDAFLKESPSFYVPTTTAIWKELLKRIEDKRGKLKAPAPEEVDLARQKPSQDVEEGRGAIGKHLAKAKPKKQPPPELTGKQQELYDKIMGASITINFPVDKLFNYRAPQVLNAFEVAERTGQQSNNIQGGLEDERRQAEEKHFGIPAQGVKVNPRIRPRYAALNFKNHPSGATARSDYGLSYMVLSDALRQHCTLTIGDSFDAPDTDYGTAFPYTRDGVRALVMAIHNLPFGVKDETLTGDGPYSPSDSYIEVQIHQDIDIRSDALGIMVSKVEMRLFALDIKTVETLIANLTDKAFVRVS